MISEHYPLSEKARAAVSNAAFKRRWVNYEFKHILRFWKKQDAKRKRKVWRENL